jgi:hypothetical protein
MYVRAPRRFPSGAFRFTAIPQAYYVKYAGRMSIIPAEVTTRSSPKFFSSLY